MAMAKHVLILACLRLLATENLGVYIQTGNLHEVWFV
jgi:hypothetical protein